MTPGRRLCRLEELTDGEAKGFPVPSAEELVAHLDQGKLTKQGDTVYFTFRPSRRAGSG